MSKTIKKAAKFVFVLFVFSLMSFSMNTEKKYIACEKLHNGTFKYGNVSDEIKVVINGENHIEYHDNGKYYIKSKLNWKSECEYDMTMIEITIPNFPNKVGDVMNVKIKKVEGNVISYIATVQGKSWDGQLIKIKD